MYFSTEIETILTQCRGWQAQVVIDKANGDERTLIGVICRGINGKWLVNQQDVDEPDFRQIPLSRVKKIKVNGLELRPKEKI